MAKLDPRILGAPDEEFTTIVDVARYGELRLQAVNLHRCQTSLFAFLPEDLTVSFFKNDSFVRAEPPWDNGSLETDLFQ